MNLENIPGELIERTIGREFELRAAAGRSVRSTSTGVWRSRRSQSSWGMRPPRPRNSTIAESAKQKPLQKPERSGESGSKTGKVRRVEKTGMSEMHTDSLIVSLGEGK